MPKFRRSLEFICRPHTLNNEHKKINKSTYIKTKNAKQTTKTNKYTLQMTSVDANKLC